MKKIEAFAELLSEQTRAGILARYPDYPAVCLDKDCEVAIKPGAKYTKVDLGRSSKYMVDADGRIFGIKAYGVIHRGHQYGTLDTIHEYDWSGYTAVRRKVAI